MCFRHTLQMATSKLQAIQQQLLREKVAVKQNSWRKVEEHRKREMLSRFKVYANTSSTAIEVFIHIGIFVHLQ